MPAVLPLEEYGFRRTLRRKSEITLNGFSKKAVKVLRCLAFTVDYNDDF
jgi:hypothetical protein